MNGKKEETTTPLGSVTPYDQQNTERRHGDRRRRRDRRTGRDQSLAMRLYRLVRSKWLHLPEVERSQPDRRKTDRRNQTPQTGSAPTRAERGHLLSQEEIKFLLHGGTV